MSPPSPLRFTFSKEAHNVIRGIKSTSGKGNLYLIVDDTGCCGDSNVFLLAGTSHGGKNERVLDAGGEGGLEIFVNPIFGQRLSNYNLNIDVYDTESDDSFSLETAVGKRLYLRMTPAVAVATESENPYSQGKRQERPAQTKPT
jgi:hypothetical protein